MIKKINFFYIAIIFLALIRVLLIVFFNNHLYNSESLKENGKIINIIKKDNRVVIDIKNIEYILVKTILNMNLVT